LIGDLPDRAARWQLGIKFDDTHKLFGVPHSGLDPDILGAIFVDDRRIV
jgi:hypothetical protein